MQVTLQLRFLWASLFQKASDLAGDCDSPPKSVANRTLQGTEKCTIQTPYTAMNRKWATTTEFDLRVWAMNKNVITPRTNLASVYYTNHIYITVISKSAHLFHITHSTRTCLLSRTHPYISRHNNSTWTKLSFVKCAPSDSWSCRAEK